MKGDILFLAHRIPFPPDRGDKIRSHHVLKHLATLAPVHIGTLVDDPADFTHIEKLAAIANSHCVVRRSKPLPVAGIEALLRAKPISLTAFYHAKIASYVKHVLSHHKIAAIYVFSGQMGQYVPEDYSGRLVVDLVDVDSAKFEAYAKDRGGVRGWIDAREGELLRREEQRLAQRADETLLISKAEADLFISRLDDGVSVPVRVLGNGMDTDGFNPAIAPEPAVRQHGGPHLMFTGQMDYPPNIAAVQRLAELIMPKVLAVHPDALCHVVGRAPVAELRALDGTNGIKVWGEVPDIRSFLSAADLVVAPLTIARGVQNKVLEAMAMARPIVLSTQAATGIAAEHGTHFCVAGDDEDFVTQLLGLLSDPSAAQAMGAKAREQVVAHYGWGQTLHPLAALLGLNPTERAQRAAA